MHPPRKKKKKKKKKKKTEESPLCQFWRGNGGVAEDIWEKHIEGRLNLADAKFFHMCCTSARDAVECAGWRVELPFRLRDLSSKETLELAWANGFSKSPAGFLGAFCFRFQCFFPLLTSFSLSGGIAQGGSIELVEWAHKTKKCRKNKQTAEFAARFGHLDLLKHLRKEKWNIGPTTVMEAAKGGQVKCMRYLREEVGIREWDPFTISTSAMNGRLEAVQYAFEHGAPIGNVACEWAAERGHLNCLKYLHEVGAPWNDRTLKKALAGGHMECYNYAKEHGCPGS